MTHRRRGTGRPPGCQSEERAPLSCRNTRLSLAFGVRTERIGLTGDLPVATVRHKCHYRRVRGDSRVQFRYRYRTDPDFNRRPQDRSDAVCTRVNSLRDRGECESLQCEQQGMVVVPDYSYLGAVTRYRWYLAVGACSRVPASGDHRDGECPETTIARTYIPQLYMESPNFAGYCIWNVVRPVYPLPLTARGSGCTTDPVNDPLKYLYSDARGNVNHH